MVMPSQHHRTAQSFLLLQDAWKAFWTSRFLERERFESIQCHALLIHCPPKTTTETPPKEACWKGTYSWLGVLGLHFERFSDWRMGLVWRPLSVCRKWPVWWDINDGIKPEEFQETCSWFLISVFFKKYCLHCWWPASMLALMCQIGLHDRAKRPVGKIAFERDLMQNIPCRRALRKEHGIRWTTGASIGIFK